MDIYDPRTVVDFQKFTFSGHLRSHVYKVIEENIKLGHADYTCYWTLELLCSGLVHSLWQTLFESAAKHINRAAPNVFLYLVQKYEAFSTYEGQYSTLAMTGIRNNHAVRTLVCEAGATTAFCRKNKLPPLPKIKPEHDFQPLTIQETLKAPSANYGRHIALKNDPLELVVPINELVYCLRPETRDLTRALYWTAWLLKYASQSKKQNKVDFACNARPNPFIDDAHARDVVWLLWDIVHDAVKTSPQTGLLTPYIDALFKLHCLRWKPGSMKQRLCFLTTAMLFICESTTLDIHAKVPHDILTVQRVIENVPQWISAILQTQKTFAT
jgi:hypothetical protein